MSRFFNCYSSWVVKLINLSRFFFFFVNTVAEWFVFYFKLLTICEYCKKKCADFKQFATPIITHKNIILSTNYQICTQLQLTFCTKKSMIKLTAEQMYNNDSNKAHFNNHSPQRNSDIPTISLIHCRQTHKPLFSIFLIYFPNIRLWIRIQTHKQSYQKIT